MRKTRESAKGMQGESKLPGTKLTVDCTGFDANTVLTNDFKSELREEKHWLLFAPIPVAVDCTCWLQLLS